MKKFNGLKKMKQNGGFTLVELIIVIAILAVIAAIAVPNLLGAIDKSRYTTDVANAKRIAEAVQIYSAENEGEITLGTGEVVGSGTGGVIVTGTGATAMDEILGKLDGAIPTVKCSKIGGGDGVHFFVSIDDDTNRVTVQAAGTANTNDVLYPEAVDYEELD